MMERFSQEQRQALRDDPQARELMQDVRSGRRSSGEVYRLLRERLDMPLVQQQPGMTPVQPPVVQRQVLNTEQKAGIVAVGVGAAIGYAVDKQVRGTAIGAALAYALFATRERWLPEFRI
jgi:hypothetical protein